MLDNYKEAITWAEMLCLQIQIISILYLLKVYKSNQTYQLNVQEGLEVTKMQLHGLIMLCLQIQNILIHYIQKSILRMLGKYEDALKMLDQALIYNPNHDLSLASKGACLNYFYDFNSVQQLSKYSEAIIYYNKAIQIDPNYKWAKNKKTECEKQFKIKQIFK